MKSKTLAFKTKLYLIIVPFVLIIGASIYSTSVLLDSLKSLSLKSLDGFKESTLQNFGKDLDSSFNSLSYFGKDAIYKRQINEDSPAEGFTTALEVFSGQLSTLTGQMASLKKDKESAELKAAFTPIHQEFTKWAEAVNTKKIDAEKANSEFKAIRKKLKEFVKQATNFKVDEGASVQGIFTFISNAQEKFKIINLVFILVSVILLVISFIFMIQMTKLLNRIIEDLKIQFDKLNHLSNNLSVQSQELSTATQEQASSIQETVSTMEEMTAMVKSNNQTAESSQIAVGENTLMTKTGVQSVEDMLFSINEVKKFTESLPHQVENSGVELKKIIDVITEINNKTKVINDIVFQTKLLSFNASVEAARAGENGKGFAVVAEEVGNLAQMSGTAAKEISDLLESSTKIVNETIENNKQVFMKSAHEISTRVSESFERASKCTDILIDIEKKALMIGSLISNITVASGEQTSGIEGINQALRQLDQVSHQNSLVANETSVVGKDLKNNAESVEVILSELIVFLRGSSRNSISQNT